MSPIPLDIAGIHAPFMRQCIELARIAKQRGDSPVGSLLVKDGQIIATGIEGGRTHKDITYHAEIEAIRQAIRDLKTQDLSPCTLYTTHEPCIMCSYVIRHTRIHMVVMGLCTGELGGLSSRYPILADKLISRWGHPPVILTGLMEQECRELSL